MNTHFVATTALEEFWDTSYPVLFLTEGCKRYSRRSYWESFESTILRSEIQEQNVFETIDYLQKVYERLLPVLAQALNDVHKVNFSTRYWRIVIGPWLGYYLHTLHDRYVQIINLKQSYPDFITTCLDDSCFVTPNDTLQFALLMLDDPYNLQLYSQLFELMGFKFFVKKAEVKIGADSPMSSYVRPKTMVNRLVERCIDLGDRVLSNRKKIVFESVYFPKTALLKLMFKMKGSFWPYVAGGQMSSGLAVNHEMRKKIGSIKFGDSEYEQILLPLISQGMPKNMLEGFSRNKSSINRKCKFPPKAIMSAVGWYFNEEFKMYAAQSAEEGTKLLGVQHGGGYGMLKYLFQEEYELSITDKYFSWGWTRNGCHAQVKPVSATKLVKEKQSSSDQRSRDILYITTVFYRFMMYYPMGTDFTMDYLKQQSLFLSYLSKGVKERLVIRPHREDSGLDFKERFRDIIPDVRIETWEQSFSRRDYGLLVCDHPYCSTTFIESLIRNKPAILFANPHFAANHINERAGIYWNKLKEIGILYDDTVEASKKIGEIYDNIDDWWNQPERQEGIRLFLSEFGRVSDQWDKEWVAALEEIIK